jgi:hypothetical protein
MESSKPQTALGNGAEESLTAKELWEHWHLLWQDQTDYARSLHERRRTYSIGLVAAAGLGVFKLDIYRPADSTPALSSFQGGVIVTLLLLATVMFICGAYELFTERATLRPWFAALVRLGDALKGWIPTVGWDVGPSLKENSDEAREVMGGRAIRSLYFPADIEDLFLKESDPSERWIRRSQMMKAAVIRLSLANRRVSQRLTLGLLAMGLGYAVIVLTILCYNLWVLI